MKNNTRHPEFNNSLVRGGRGLKRLKWTSLAIAISTFTVTACDDVVKSSPSSLLVTNTAARTADIYLIAGYNRSNLWENFNGYSNGHLTISVPVGYHVRLHITNDGGIPYDVGIYTMNQQLAFPGAGNSLEDYLNNPAAGIMPGSSAIYSFVANRTGEFRLADYLYRFPEHHPSHLPLGMWGVFRVTPTGVPQATST